MSGDRRIEILDSSTPAFETRLDAAVRLADGICPLGPRNLSTNQIEARLQGLSTLGPRQALDPERDLRDDGLRNRDLARSKASRSTNARLPFMSAETALVSST